MSNELRWLGPYAPTDRHADDVTLQELVRLRVENEKLREALETFANNVKETNEGIDENWAKTVYPLKAENQRLREALKKIAASYAASFGTYKLLYESWRKLAVERVDIARAALKGDE
jgi:regulator of replication initiation timing